MLGKKDEFDVVVYIEISLSSPFQIEWKKIKRKLSFIPYPGLLLQQDEKLFVVINSIYNLNKNVMEVYTREQNMELSLPPSAVN